MKAIILTAFIAVLLLPGIVQAACSIGANPLTMDARASPGQIVEAVWNLYNIHGDRVTHVKVIAIESPDWDIWFEPELHEATYNVTGVLETIGENVGLEPTEVVDSIPDPKPEGMDYVNYPGGPGYIPVRPVKIFIRVPEDAELWKDYKVVLEATGNCFMEPGAVVPGIATQLEIDIHTVSGGEFYEERVEPTPQEPPEGGEIQEGGEAPGEGFDLTGFLISNASWIGAIILLIVLLAYFGAIRNRSKYIPYSYTG